MYAIGLMSGTSLDGLDVVLCEVQGHSENTMIRCIDFVEYPLDEQLKKKIKKACLCEDFSPRDLCSLNFEFGRVCSNAIRDIKNKNNCKDEDIAFVASHGQTIYHLPCPNENEVASTLQIGEPSIIAFDHKVQVISNFRVMDMAAGGQGAPLVPYSEKILYGKKNKTIALQNIGGISNVTCINDDVIAFDTGPGNMMIDQAMLHLYNAPFDSLGNTATKGSVITEMLEELMAHPFITQAPPKTTGREDFGQQLTEQLLKKYRKEKNEDIICTLTKFTAKSIAYNYLHNLSKLPDEAIVGGGGAYNLTLIKMLKEELPMIEIKTQEDLGYSSSAKEAIAFVILGNQTLHKRPSNERGATGAKENVILGMITQNPFAYEEEL